MKAYFAHMYEVKVEIKKKTLEMPGNSFANV